MMSETSCESEQITVWLFITALCVGGAERTLVDLANGLDDDRYDVTVWTIFDANPLAADLQSTVTVRSLTSAGRVKNSAVDSVKNPLVYVVVPVRFCYTAAVERPDIIHSFLFFDNILARIAGIVAPSTIITGVRSVPNEPNRIRAIVDRATIGLSDLVVSNSEAGSELAITRGAAADRVTVVRNGRDISTYQQAEAEAISAELDLDDELVVGTVGRHLERKGHFELVTAWSQLQETAIDATLVFVGDGPDREAIEQHAQELGCTDSIEFLGMRDDVPALLSVMDVFAFPSHFEGLPGAVIEAMAAGLPIVATPVDGTGELLDNYQTGLFVSVNAPDELAWALTRLLEAPALRTALGDAAEQEATQEFTIERMVTEFDEQYRTLTDTTRQSDSPLATV